MTKALIELLDWCGQHSALLVAVAGFAASVTIARITSGLDLRRALCLRRFEAYEKAIGHLSLKLNVYFNILAVFQTLTEPDLAVEVMKSKVAVLLSLFIRLSEIEKEDGESTVIILYSKLPSHDVRPMMKEIALFGALLQDFSYRANLPNAEEQLKQLAPHFIDGVKRLEPLVEEEANHLNTMFVKLYDEIHKDKTIKKILCLK